MSRIVPTLHAVVTLTALGTQAVRPRRHQVERRRRQLVILRAAGRATLERALGHGQNRAIPVVIPRHLFDGLVILQTQPPTDSISRMKTAWTVTGHAASLHSLPSNPAPAMPNAPGRSRTASLLIRSQMLYPVELRALTGLAVTTRSQICYRVRVASPAHIFSRRSRWQPQAKFRGNQSKVTVDGRYKTRTCDLHDVNVAL